MKGEYVCARESDIEKIDEKSERNNVNKNGK